MEVEKAYKQGFWKEYRSGGINTCVIGQSFGIGGYYKGVGSLQK